MVMENLQQKMLARQAEEKTSACRGKATEDHTTRANVATTDSP